MKLRRLAKTCGRLTTNVAFAVEDRVIKWAGREPADEDPDERELAQEGFEELYGKAFGQKDMSPGGKVALALIASGLGRYFGGKKIDRRAERRANILRLEAGLAEYAAALSEEQRAECRKILDAVKAREADDLLGELRALAGM